MRLSGGVPAHQLRSTLDMSPFLPRRRGKLGKWVNCGLQQRWTQSL